MANTWPRGQPSKRAEQSEQMEHSSLITGYCHAAARRAATTFLSFLIPRLSKLSASSALGMSEESLRITRICDECVSCTSADEAQGLVQMSLKACKQAGCETPSPSQPVKELHSSRAGGSQTTAGGTSLPTNARNRELTVLCSQPPPNIPLPPSAQCSPKPFPAVGQNTDCSMEWVQAPRVFQAVTPNPRGSERGKPSPVIPGEGLNSLVSTKGRHSSCSAPTLGFLSSCLETTLSCLLSHAAC